MADDRTKAEALKIASRLTFRAMGDSTYSDIGTRAAKIINAMNKELGKDGA